MRCKVSFNYAAYSVNYRLQMNISIHFTYAKKLKKIHVSHYAWNVKRPPREPQLLAHCMDVGAASLHGSVYSCGRSMWPVLTTTADAYYLHLHMTHNHKSSRALRHWQPMWYIICLWSVDAVYDNDVDWQFTDSCGRNILRSALLPVMALIPRHLASTIVISINYKSSHLPC